jgi:hypothetical protein
MSLTSLKAKYRTWSRNRKKLKKLAEADVVILRYPKSGVTWLRVMISNAYRGHLGSGASGLVGRSDFHKARPDLPNIFVSMDNFGVPRDDFERRLAGKKVLMLVRDPRDVAISHYFSYAKRASAVERVSAGVPDTVEAEGPFAFATNPHYGMIRIIDFLNHWSAVVRRHPQGLMMKYEDLRAGTEEHFATVMKLIEPGIGGDHIRAAVEAADFERMKEKEAQGSFGLDILQPGVAGDSDSFKVRRGKIGGYADYLTPEQKAVLDEMVKTRLDPALGYA